MSSCTSTWFDPRWDPRLRRLIQEAVQRTDLRITSAFERAGCTTLEAAKRLTASSSCLEGFTEEQRQIFIDAVGLADLRGNDTDIHIALIIGVCAFFLLRSPIPLSADGPRPYQLQGADYAYFVHELPPRVARSLYVILKDERLLELDPQETLMASLQKQRQVRLANAKLMTHQSPYLAGIPLPVVVRFLELVAVSEVPYDKSLKHYTQHSTTS
eukprot:11716-Heterococcus_DN1.PRE.2